MTKYVVSEFHIPGTTPEEKEESKRKLTKLLNQGDMDLEHFCHVICPKCFKDHCFYRTKDPKNDASYFLSCSGNIWFMLRPKTVEVAQDIVNQAITMMGGVPS